MIKKLLLLVLVLQIKPLIADPIIDGNPCFPEPRESCIPVDGGIIFLIAGGVILGIYFQTKTKERVL